MKLPLSAVLAALMFGAMTTASASAAGAFTRDSTCWGYAIWTFSEPWGESEATSTGPTVGGTAEVQYGTEQCENQGAVAGLDSSTHPQASGGADADRMTPATRVFQLQPYGLSTSLDGGNQIATGTYQDAQWNSVATIYGDTGLTEFVADVESVFRDGTHTATVTEKHKMSRPFCGWNFCWTVWVAKFQEKGAQLP